MNVPHRVANRVIEELNILSPEDLRLLELIALERGALVRELPLSGSEARITVLGQKAIITVSTHIRNPQRRRFSIAHELGHFELHRQQQNLIICADQEIETWGKKGASVDLEVEANQFAAALLLPDRFVASIFREAEPSLSLLMDVSIKLEVSITATAIRYLSYCNEAMAVVMSENNHIKWFQGSSDFEDLELFVDVKARLDRSTAASRFFQGDQIPDKWKKVPASAWLRPGGYREDSSVFEHSMAIPSQNSVLTLLWVEDEVDEDDVFF